MQEILQRIDEKKKKLDHYRPLPPELVKNLEEWFAVDYTYNSNAIEGNTLSLDETALVVEKGITADGKTINEHLDAIDHMEALTYIKTLSCKSKKVLTTEDLLSINKIAFQRTVVPIITIDNIQWLHDVSEHPIIIAALAHVKLITMHSFVDGLPDEALAKSGNGRTSRLLMNLLLLQQGYPIAIIKNVNRKAYIQSLVTAQETDDCTDFFMIVARAVEESIDIYLKSIEE